MLLKILFALALTADPSGEEIYIKKMIEKEANSEQHRFEYANLLFTEDRFDEALAQLKILFQLNPKHEEGLEMQKGILELQKISNPMQRRLKKLDFANQSFHRSAEKFKKSAEDIMGADAVQKSREQNAERKREFKEKYEALFPKQYKIKMNESQKYVLASKYRMSDSKDEAEKIYTAAIQEFSDSPEARITFADFLIQERRFPEAEKLIAETAEKFPDEVKVKLYQEYFEKMKPAKSKEAQDDLKLELQKNLVAWNSAYTDFLMRDLPVKK